MTLRDYLHFITSANSLEELWAAHTEQMLAYGFDRLIYGYTRYRTETSLGDPEDFVVLTNHDKTYVDGFLHRGLYFHAPMLRWALDNEGAGSWRRITQIRDSQAMTAEERKVYEFNQKMGVTAGYTISFNSVSVRSKGAISLCAREGLSQDEVEEIWEAHRRVAQALDNA